MRHSKWLAGIGVGTVLALAMTGCAGSGGSNSSAGPTTITILSTSEIRDAMTSAISKFEKENKDITVKITYASEAALTSTLPTQLAAGNAADVFTTWPGTYSQLAAGQLGKAGYVANLSSSPWAKQIPKEFDEYVGIGNKVYYAPLASLSIITMYNQTALDKAGLKIPATWNQVLSFCKAADAKGVIPYAYGAQTDWENQMLPFLLVPTLVNRVQPDFPSLRAANKATFADSGWLTVFTKEKQMSDAGCFSSPLGTSSDNANAEVAQGKALATFGPSSTFSSIQQPAGSSKIVAASFPATNNANQTWLPVALGASFSVNAKTKHLAAAKAFLNFLMEPANANAYAKASGQAPALKNSTYKTDATTELQTKYGQEGKTAPVPDQLFPVPAIRDAWITTNEQLLGGSATPADVVKAMDAAWPKN